MEIFSFIILLLLCAWFIRRVKIDVEIRLIDLYLIFSGKVIYGLVFVLIFTFYYGEGHLSGDAFEFMKDSRVLKDLAMNHPGEFIKIWTDLGEPDPKILHQTLDLTNIWTTSNNGDFLNDNRLIIRINSLIHFISFNSPYVHALVFSFFSFFGSILIFLALKQFIARKRLFLYLLCLFPSIGFWSSGITKESLLVLSIGLFLYGLSQLLRDIKTANGPLRNYAVLAAGAFLLCINKPHVGLVLLSCALLLILGKQFKFNASLRIVFVVALPIITFLLTYAPTPINLIDKVSYKQKDLINLGKGGVFFVTDSSFCAFDYSFLKHFTIGEDSIGILKATPGEYKLFGESTFYSFEIPVSNKKYERYLVQAPSNSFIETDRINYSRMTLLRNTPMALINVLIRPFPSDPGSPLKHLAFISNCSILSLFLLSFVQRKSVLEKEEKYWITYFILAILAITLIIGWTIPILGAIVRYKMAIDLLFVITSFIILKKKTKAS